MKILMSGASGLVGSVLVKRFETAGHDVYRLVHQRGAKSPKEIPWNWETEDINPTFLEGMDAVIHLAGENIAARRWSKAQKKLILKSRVEGTRLLSNSIAGLSKPPKVFLSASAIGFYGDRGNEEMVEESGIGDGFLAETCEAWEAETLFVRKKGIRTVHMRIGVVLSKEGGALKKMLPPFKMGVGGNMGSGEQYMSWISLDDLVSAMEFCLKTETMSGAVNLVSPFPATNAEFTKTLGKVLGRPTVFAMPAFAAKLAFGEMAEALLLASTRVIPKKLLQAGFSFQFPKLEDALRHHLK